MVHLTMSKQTRIQYTRIEAWYMLELLNQSASTLDPTKFNDVLIMNTKMRAKLMAALDRIGAPAVTPTMEAIEVLQNLNN